VIRVFFGGCCVQLSFSKQSLKCWIRKFFKKIPFRKFAYYSVVKSIDSLIGFFYRLCGKLPSCNQSLKRFGNIRCAFLGDNNYRTRNLDLLRIWASLLTLATNLHRTDA